MDMYNKNRYENYTTSANYQELPDGTRRMYSFNTPPQPTFDNEEMIGSIQRMLSENIGEYVVISFLIGTQEIVRKQGILYFVGRSFVTLFDDQAKNFIVCDIFSVKFVYFYMPGDRPKTNFNALPPTSTSSNGRDGSHRR